MADITAHDFRKAISEWGDRNDPHVNALLLVAADQADELKALKAEHARLLDELHLRRTPLDAIGTTGGKATVATTKRTQP
jgi:hypothetical protein